MVENAMPALLLSSDERLELKQHLETAVSAITDTKLVLSNAYAPSSALRRADVILGKLAELQDLCGE